MKKIFKVLAIIALVAVIGFSMACGGGGNTHEHKWGNWNVTTAATCSATGTGSRVCTECGETDPNTTIPIDPTAHDCANWTQTTAPTCLTAGIETGTCTRNATHTATRTGAAALGHDYEWVVTTPATDTTEGIETKTCKRDPTHTDGTRTFIKPFTSIADFVTWLSAQPNNTAATAYNVKLNVNNLDGDSSTTGSVGKLLYDNRTTKYISLDLSGSTFNSIISGAFANCTSLTSVTIPNSVTSISNSAFQGCTGLTSIIIPDSVTSIGYASFYLCTNLSSITIPNSVTRIENLAFSGCSSLTSVTIPFVGASKNGTTNTHFGYIFGASSYSSQNSSIPASLKTVIITGGNSIPNDAFYDCAGLTSITMPDSVTIIGGSAFSRCTNLTSVTIPNSVTSIRESAFYNCTSLTSVRFERAGTTFDYIVTPPFPYTSSLQTAYTAGGIGTYTLSGYTWTKTSN